MGDSLTDYRGLAKLRSTYTDKLPEMVNPDTGRVHTSYHQSGADLIKVKLQLGKVGILDAFGDHVYSGQDMPNTKPHPD
ncbi:DNA polymerase, partial [Stenotrophomonas sp. 3diitr2024]|uniref:DNA polymerase n=1 Tax=Stenotrophomonas sp. 3diitr2024 TaxID=3345115 RepID=UPI0035CB01E9